MSHDPDGRDRFDWDRAEADLTNDPDPDADVLDLDAARAHRAGRADDDRADNDDTGPVPVDSVAAQRRPRFTLTGLKEGERRPILPPWMRSRAEAAAAAAWVAGLAMHTTGYH